MATETIEVYRDGQIVERRAVTVPDDIANERRLRAAAHTALQANRDFLTLNPPTNAQTLAQVKALTRQNQGIIRLLLGQLDATD